MKHFAVLLILCMSAGSIVWAMNFSNSDAKNNELPKTIVVEDTTKLRPNFDKENEYDLVNLVSLDTNLTIELRYASTNNFAGTQFYPFTAKAMLRRSTAEKLKNANEELYTLGYRIKVLDAYRPYKYQQALRDAAEAINPSWGPFIADPKTGSLHNRGVSVDITLTDLEGRELDMPTTYDYFGKEASINYNGCTEEQKKNRELLGTIMVKHGFRRISSEWWHFDDIDYKDYDIIDVGFNEL